MINDHDVLLQVEFDREEYSQILNDYPELSITLEEGANFLLGVQEMLDIVLSSDFCQEAEYTEVCARFQVRLPPSQGIPLRSTGKVVTRVWVPRTVSVGRKF